MKNENDHVFSAKYVRKKEAMIRCVRKAQKNEVSAGVGVPVRILMTAAVVCIMLTATTFAAARLGVFNIRREDTKTVVQLGNTDSAVTDDIIMDNENHITIPSSYEERGEIPSLIFHKDYMPASVVEGENSTEIKFGDFEKGTSLSFNVVYLGGEGFVCNLGVGAEIEEFEVNGHDALIIKRGETVHFNRILTVYFEDKDVLVICYVGYGIPDEDVKKIAEGLRFEETENTSLAYPIVHNYGHMNLGESLSNLPKYLPLAISEEIQLGSKIVFNDTVFIQDGTDANTLSADIEIIPTNIKVLDNISYLDRGCLREEFTEYIDEDGNFVAYPRTEIVKGDTVEADHFGETVMVRKKLVLVEMKIKNTSDEAVYAYTVGDIQLHVGHEEDITSNYVYDSTPDKNSTSSIIAYYDAGSEGKSFYKTGLDAGEEITVNVGFLVDEDMLDEAYILFGKTSALRYHLKLFE